MTRLAVYLHGYFGTIIYHTVFIMVYSYPEIALHLVCISCLHNTPVHITPVYYTNAHLKLLICRADFFVYEYSGKDSGTGLW